MENIYLKRYATPGPALKSTPHNNTGIIVVIPSYNEPDILRTIHSLSACQHPGCHVEIIVVINHGSGAPLTVKTQNQATIRQLNSARNSLPPSLSLELISAFDLPEKTAGVGLARKIGMDEAVRRFELLKKSRGIIACLDADCIVDPNYLIAILECFQEQNPAVGLLYFEHDIENTSDKLHRLAIINYELHLRYYVQALRFAGFPFADQTVGSCITVSSEAYQRQGGMNTRKAGEDFYFLQRMFLLDKTVQINSSTVRPSSRASDRVPFGTGKAISKLMRQQKPDFMTYHPDIFLDFKHFTIRIPDIWKENQSDGFRDSLPESINTFLDTIGFQQQVDKIKKNNTTSENFRKAFYGWFNGFMAMKFVHFARDHYHGEMEILDAARWLIAQKRPKLAVCSREHALQLLREIDRSEN